ncbi:hypothetical protein ABDB91_04860 [Desulfoscipio sp. XC116]
MIKNNRKSFVLPTPEYQPLADSLSITYNFSFGRLWIALHKKPGEQAQG